MKFLGLKFIILTSLFFLNLSMVHAASLSYFEQSTGGLIWKLFSPETNTISTIHIFKEKPSALYWERDNKRILVLKDKQILTFDHKGAIGQWRPRHCPAALGGG